MLSSTNHYLTLIWVQLVWMNIEIYSVIQSSCGICRVGPISCRLLDRGEFAVSANEDVPCTEGIYCPVCMYGTKGQDNLAIGKTPAHLGRNNKASRLVGATEMHQGLLGWVAVRLSRVPPTPQGQHPTEGRQRALDGSLRKIAAKLIINFYFLPYTKCTQHWTQVLLLWCKKY